MPDVPTVTCVQWAYQILCLSLCVPLNEKTLTRLGVYDVFKTNWPNLMGKTRPDIEGAGRLPFIPHSPAQVLQAFLDSYAGGSSLPKFLQNPSAQALLTKLLEGQKLSGVPQVITTYLDQVLRTGDITQPLQVQGQPPYRFILPITFFCEARSAFNKQPNEPWIQYVGTMVHESMVKRAT